MTDLVEWRAPERPTMLQLLPAATREAGKHSLLLAGLFAAIAIGGLVLALMTPKSYTSSTTLLVEETNIIQPLLEGRTVTTGVIDRAAVAREVAFSRKATVPILEAGGWLDDTPDPAQQAQLFDQIVARTSITNPRENLKLIQISYTDTDPRRAQAVTERFGQLIIQESFRTKERESRAAFEFIDSQVDEYQRMLNDAEDKLAAYRKEHPEVLLGDQEDVTRRISELRLEIDRSLMDQAEQQSQAGAWAGHVSRERSIGAAQARTGPLRARLDELQAERIRLSGTYTDQHPDMVRIQGQIRDLEAQLRQGGLQSTAAAGASMDGNADRGRLTEARSRSSGAASRIAAGNRLLAQEMERLNLVASLGSELANLTRDFEVSRALYQDLLERRENARLAMNLDIQRGGLNFRVQEPAALPMRSSSMSLSQVSVAVLVLAVAVPALLLLGWLRLDPRVRTTAQIEQVARLPVLGTIPPVATRRSRTHNRHRLALAVVLLLTVPISYALALTLK